MLPEDPWPDPSVDDPGWVADIPPDALQCPACGQVGDAVDGPCRACGRLLRVDAG